MCVRQQQHLNLSRQRVIKRDAARKLRATGRIPAIVYGRGKESRAVSLDPAVLSNVLRGSHSGMNTLIDLKVGGQESVVLVRDIQRDPANGRSELVSRDLSRNFRSLFLAELDTQDNSP